MTGLPGFGLDGAQFTGDCRPVENPELEEIHRLYYTVYEHFSEEPPGTRRAPDA